MDRIFFPHDRDWNDIINFPLSIESKNWVRDHHTKVSIRLQEHKEGNYVLTLLLTQETQTPEDWKERILEFDDCITPEQVAKLLDQPVNLGSFTNAMSFRPSKLGETLFQRTLEQLLEQGDTRVNLKIVDIVVSRASGSCPAWMRRRR